MSKNNKKVPEFLNYFLEDCLEGDSQFTKKSLFGGYGIYKNGKIFSIFTGDAIYFKTDENNRHDYEKAGSKPFSFTKKKSGKTVTLCYWELPEEIMENKDELDIWIERSLEV